MTMSAIRLCCKDMVKQLEDLGTCTGNVRPRVSGIYVNIILR